MMPGLLKAVHEDLTRYAPHLPAGDRDLVAQRMLTQLTGRWGLAEYRLDAQYRVSWLFDPRSGRLLSTYPDGASRIRSVDSTVERP